MREFSTFFEVNSNKYNSSLGQKLFLDSFHFISIGDWSNIRLLHMFLKLLFLVALSVFIQVTLIKSSSLYINRDTPFFELLLTVSYYIHLQLPLWGPSLTALLHIHQHTPFSERFMSVSFLFLSVNILHYQRRL